MLSVNVNLKTTATSAASKFVMSVSENETVKSFQDKVATAQMLAFPDHHLEFKGQRLAPKDTLQACGVAADSTVDFVLEATEESVVTQLKELLQARDLTCDELGLLYCYKHGVSTNQALKTLGVQCKLADFLQDRKEFVLDGKKVSLARSGASLQPVSVAEQVEGLLADGPMDVTQLCAKFSQKFKVSLSSLVEARPADFLAQDPRFRLLPDGKVCKAADVPKAKYVPPQRRTQSPRPARSQSPKAAQRSRSQDREAPKRVALASKGENDEMYAELHTTISSRSFNSRISQALTTAQDLVKHRLPLNIAEVAKGGSVAKGTAVTGCEDAELVLFLEGLPSDNHQRWLPPLLRSVKGVMEETFKDEIAAGSLEAELTETSVRLKLKDLAVDLRFSPTFDSYAHTVQALGSLGPNARKPFDASFVKERTAFVQKQPGNVKVTIRLLKWWRDQQSWSCSLTKPNDYLMELVAIYAYQQCGRLSQSQMVANCMSIFARFDQLRVMWSNYYEQKDVWAPLMMQRPLLMDPVNPFTNIADPQDFDPRELTAFAAKTHFFW